jgi:hypothetical protein
MTLHTFRNARLSVSNPAKLRWRQPFLEILEDRVVPSIADGTLLVATSPSSYANADQSGFPTGIIGVNPTTGTQTPVSLDPQFRLPTYIAEGSDGQLYVTDLEAAGGQGAIFRVDPNTGVATILASSGYINGPNAIAFVNGFVYVADAGVNQNGVVHNIVRIDSQGNQTLITDGPDRIDGGTNGTFFVVPTGMVPGPGDTVYLADEPGGFQGPSSGALWQVNVDTGQQMEINKGGFFNHPVDVAIDAGGNVLVANTGTNANGVAGSLFKINPLNQFQTSIVSTFGPFSGTNSVEAGESSTIFVGAFADGDKPGSVLTVNPTFGTYFTRSSSGYLSLVEGMRTYRQPSVQAAPTSTTLTSSLNPSVFGNSVTFTAAVALGGGSGIPTGSVSFFDGSTFLNAAPLNGASIATYTISTLTAGSHSITASYSGDSNFLASQSNPITQSVSQAGTSTTLSSSSFPSSVYGQLVAFTATVSSSSGVGTPTGLVQFQIDNGNPVGVGLSGAGTATYSPSSLPVGTHVVTATYAGDSNFLNSGASLTQTVTKASTNTAVTSGVNPSAFGQSVLFTATVSSSSGGLPTGAVTFFDTINNQTTQIGQGTLNSGVATIPIATLGPGAHTVTVSYGGDSNFQVSSNTAAPFTQTVKLANTATVLTGSPNPSQTGQKVVFTATISVQLPGTTAAAFPTNTVTLFDVSTNTTLDTEPLSTNAGVTTASFNISSLKSGTHKLTATYNGDTNFAGGTSGIWTQTVTNVLIGTTTTLSSSTNNASVFGQSVVFTATVTPNSGSGTPTGSVQFVIDNGTPVNMSLNGSGIAAYTTNSLKAGTHTVMANYTGDSTFGGSSSPALTQTVNQANTSTMLSSSMSQTVFGQAVTFSAVVSATPPGAGTPTGAAQFTIDNGTPIKVGLGGNGAAAYTTSSLTAGTHTVMASYTGDGSFLNSSSSGLTQTVNQANTKTTLTSSVNPVVFGQTVTFSALVSAVAPGAGGPTGSVQFVIDNGTPVTKSLDGNGAATYSTSSLGLGTHTVMVSYSGDTNFLTSNGAALTQTVNKQAPTTTTSVSSSLNPSVFGQTVSFTAVVSPQLGGSTPTGSVQFVIDNGSPVSMPLNGSGTAIYSSASLGAGTHRISASYSGDGNFLPSSSGPLKQTVNPANTSLTVSSSLNPSPFGMPVTFTASVGLQGPGSGMPTGTVQFQINGSPVSGPVSVSNSGTASFSYTFYSLNTQAITAIYSGDNNFSGSSGALPGGQRLFFSIGFSTSTTVSSSNNSSLFGQNVVFTATINGGFAGIYTPTGTVQFIIDGRNGGSPVSVTTFNGITTASYSTSSLAVGTHSVQAVYSGDSTFASSSDALAGGQTVIPSSSTTTMTAVNSALSPSVFGQSVLFTATITANGGSGTPSGTVQFAIDGSQAGGPVNVSGSGGVATASFSTASLAAGTHSVTASYSGDATFLGSSGSFTQTVNQASTNTAVSSSANPSTVGQMVTFTATMSAQSPGSGTPTGSVQFQINGSPVGSPVSASGSGGVVTASFTTTFSLANTFVITANYSGDANFAGSNGSFTQTVQTGSTSSANVTVTLNPATGVLSITGDSGNDAFTVTQSSPGVLQIAGVNTLINQSTSPATYALSSISAINISLLNGDDSVSLSNFQIAGTLSIAAGSGSDSLTLDTITANYLNVFVAGPAADTLTLNNLTLGSAAVGAGANAILTLNGVSCAGTMGLTAGSNATVSVNSLAAAGNLNINLGDDTQAVTVKGSSAVNWNIRQTGSTGNPLFDLEYDSLTNLNLQAGSGNNQLVLSHLNVEFELVAFLGNGNNTLTADHVTALFGIISGSPVGKNVYINGGNNSGLIVLGFQQN